MSEVMEKTFSSVSGFIMNSLGSRNLDISPGFHNLIRSIRKARSKTEEEKAIRKELELLKLKLQQPDTSVAKIKEYLVRIMYCEVLGYTASFSYIPAIKLIQQGSLVTKRVGYLAASLFLHEGHELVLLLVNTIQRDLSSTNMLHNCMALAAVCWLIGPQMAPAVLPLVQDKLTHSNALVRKKAVLALRALFSKAPHLLQNPEALFKQALCDRDEAVTSAALHIHSDLIKDDPAAHKQLVRPLVAILRQVAGRKLSADLEYHGVPAPWMQIHILRMLAMLGTGDEYYSNLMYDLLDDILQQTSSLSHNIAYAVQYECLIAVATIHPHQQLLAKAAQCISKYLKSFNYNLRYMGICALSTILKAYPGCAEEHQLTMVDCLDDADDTIRLKTLELLVRVTSSSNVQAICDRLLTHLEGTTDMFVRRDLLAKIIQLAEDYRPSVRWYLDTMTRLLLTGGSLVPTGVVNNIIGAISKGSHNGEDIGCHALQLYLPLLNQKDAPLELVQISCWVLGEFAHLASAPPSSELLNLLSSRVSPRRVDDDLNLWAVAALAKVVASSGLVSEAVQRAIEMCQKEAGAELRQRVSELQVLAKDLPLMKAVYARPPDSSQDEQFDWTLSFLDEFVSDALAQGVAPYKPKQQRHAERQQEVQVTKPQFSGLNFVPYRSPTPSQTSCATVTSASTPNTQTAVKSIPSDPSLSSGASGNSGEPRMTDSPKGLRLDGVRRVWGQEGYGKSSGSSGSQSGSQTAGSQGSHSATAAPSSPARGFQPSVQLSSATAIGRTTTSHQSATDTPTEEERKKQELARALFGGLHTTMTSNSKKPMDRKPEAPSRGSMVSPRNNALHDEIREPGQADLLLLSDLDGGLPATSLSGIFQSGPQDSGERAERKETEKQGSEGAKRRPRTQEDRVRTEVSDGTDPDQERPDGPNATMASTGEGHPSSMYDDFKEADVILNRPESLDSMSLTELCITPRALGNRPPSGDDLNHLDTPTDRPPSDRSSRESDLPNHSSSTNSNPLKSLSNDADYSLKTLEAADSNTDTVTAFPSLGESTAELSILDTSPDDTVRTQSQPGPQLEPLPQDWQTFPGSKEATDLCSDTTVSARLYKVWKPDSLGLVFRVTNLTPTNGVTDLRIKLNVSSNLKVTETGQVGSLSASHLEPNTTTTLLADLHCSTPALHMNLGGEITYKDQTRFSRRLFFSTPLPISDLLRSLTLPTSEFGQLWPTQGRDAKLSAKLSVALPMSEVMTLLTQELHLHLVEIISNEGIACGSLLSGPSCLLHAKLIGKTSLDLWLRSSSQLLTDCVARQCREDILTRL